MIKTLYEELRDYGHSDYYGFHMPGHKRNGSVTGAGLPYGIDITEIDGFDDLHHARGILKEAQERAARVYCAEETCFLVNGSTAGILSAILGCTRRGDQILAARNCHKSVYHAIYMNELEPFYIYPQFDAEKELNGPVEPEMVETMLREHPDIRAVMITSPTYDGVISDVKKIAETAHAHGIPLIVDEAHGAHFGFHPYFPERANQLGADVVINSVHKTLPALTQTALIHMNGTIADREEIKRYLHMLQSSSPSYVLMASIDACVNMLETRGGEVFAAYVNLLESTRRQLKGLRHLRLVETDDASKLVISVKGTNCTGRELNQILLEKYHLQMEMTAGSYVLGITSVGDTKEGMERLVRALYEIDDGLDDGTPDVETGSKGNGTADGKGRNYELPHLERIYTSAETAALLKKAEDFGKKRRNGCLSQESRLDMPGKTSEKDVRVLPWEQSAGYVSAEYAYLYPPGIPLIVPGERISGEVIHILLEYRKIGFEIEGLQEAGKIKVLL